MVLSLNGIVQYMHQLQLIGQNPGQIFNTRIGCAHTMQLHCFETKLPILMLNNFKVVSCSPSIVFNLVLCCYEGATTLNTTTFSITTISTLTFSTLTFSTLTFSTLTFIIMSLSIIENKTRHSA